MKEAQVILNRLLDKFENSKHLSEPNTSRRRVMLRIDKRELPEYQRRCGGSGCLQYCSAGAGAAGFGASGMGEKAERSLLHCAGSGTGRTVL